MKATQKRITIIIWCCSITITMLAILAGFGATITKYVAGTMFSVSSIATLLYFLPINQRVKAVAVLLLTGLATLMASIMLHGNSGTFIASFIVLGMALMYFDPKVMVAYSTIYLSICFIVDMIDPILLIGSSMPSYMGKALMFVYLIMSSCFFIGTRYGEKLIQSAIRDRKDAQEKSEIVEKKTRIAQKISEAMGQQIEHGHTIVEELSQDVSLANTNMLQVHESEVAVQHKFEELMKKMNDSTQWIEENYQLIDSLQENYSIALENVNESKMYSNNAQNSMKNISEAIQHASEYILKSSQETEKISAIIEDINNIATQTNLLAINASIEAARVTVGGAGFEIVAEQIRMLSQKSKESAENINQILSVLSDVLADTNDRVSKGKKAIVHGNANLEHMVTCIDKIDRDSKQSQETLHQEVTSFEQIKKEFATMVTRVEKSLETTNVQMSDLEVVVDAITSQTNRTELVSNHLIEMDELTKHLQSQFV